MKKKRITTSEEEIQLLREDISQLEKWETLSLTGEGKFLVEFLKDNIKQVEDDWRNALLAVDDNNLLNFRAASRSKIQTLKALIARLEEAQKDKMEQQQLLDSLTPNGE